MVISNEHLITLNVHFPRDKNVHSMQFDNQILIADLCQQIQQYLPIKLDHDQSEFGLFIDESKGYWLEPSKTLSYYPLKNGVREKQTSSQESQSYICCFLSGSYGI